MSDLEARIAEVLEEAWDAGNCTGLDGWVGPARGSEVDSEAMDSRERDTAKLAAMLAPVIAEAQAEALREAADWMDGRRGSLSFASVAVELRQRAAWLTLRLNADNLEKP